AAGADDDVGPLAFEQRPDAAPHAPREKRPAEVAPPRVPVQRLDRQQLEAKRIAWQDIGLDPPLRPDQHRLDARLCVAQRLRQREGRHEMPTGAAARDEHLHGTTPPRLRPCPTLISTPVATSEMNKLERP